METVRSALTEASARDFPHTIFLLETLMVILDLVGLDDGGKVDIFLGNGDGTSECARISRWQPEPE
jgi:hypothetical protein